MKLVTAATKDYLDLVNTTTKRTKLEGYDTHVVEIDADDSEFNDGVQRCSYKPSVMLAMMEKFNDDILWIDGDACVIRNIDEIKDIKADVMVTMRRQNERKGGFYADFSSYLNSGVVFVRNNEAGQRFLRWWITEIDFTIHQSDQEAISDLVRIVSDLKEYNVTHDLKGIKVLVKSTEEYNNYYFDKSMNKAKIVHFKGTRGKIPNGLQKMLGV